MKTIDNLLLKISPSFKNVLTLEGLDTYEIIVEKIDLKIEELYTKHNINIKNIDIDYDEKLPKHSYMFFIDNEKVINSSIRSDKLIAMHDTLELIVNSKIFKEPVFKQDASYVEFNNATNLLNKGAVIISADIVISAHIVEYIKAIGDRK